MGRGCADDRWRWSGEISRLGKLIGLSMCGWAGSRWMWRRSAGQYSGGYRDSGSSGSSGSGGRVSGDVILNNGGLWRGVVNQCLCAFKVDVEGRIHQRWLRRRGGTLLL